MLGRSARVFQEVLHRVLKAAEFPPKYIRFHDLRHTFASHWVMGDGDIYRLRAICGWKSDAMVRRYAHLSPEAFKDDYGRLGAAPKKAEIPKRPERDE